MMHLRALLVLSALAGAAPLAAKDKAAVAVEAGPIQQGVWHRVFALDIERTLGRSVLVDTASMRAGGLGRSFKQAETLLSDQGSWSRGTTIYSRRSVNCATLQSTTYSWTALAPSGAQVSSGTVPAPKVSAMQWDSAQGKVLGFVCKGIKPR